MTDGQQLDDLARDLHAIRAEPDPEFARELDGRAAEWLREGERRRRVPWLRVAAPAFAAAAAVVIALAVVGGDGGEDAASLSVAVVPAKQGQAEGLSAAPQRDSAAGAEEEHGEAERAFLTSPPPAPAGEPLVATYSIQQEGRGRVRLDDRETRVEVPAGEGTLEISTEGLEPGSYDLEIDLPPVPAQQTRVEILPGD